MDDGAVEELIEPTLRTLLARHRFERVEIRFGEGRDGAPVLFLELGFGAAAARMLTGAGARNSCAL